MFRTSHEGDTPQTSSGTQVPVQQPSSTSGTEPGAQVGGPRVQVIVPLQAGPGSGAPGTQVERGTSQCSFAAQSLSAVQSELSSQMPPSQ